MRKGFTLIELLIVIAIIGILASIIVVKLSGGRERASDAKRKTELKQVGSALETYYAQYGEYPDDNGKCISSVGVGSSACNDDQEFPGTVEDNWSYIDTSNMPNLVTSDLNISELPIDPINDEWFFYNYKSYCGTTHGCKRNGICCNYELRARLESGTGEYFIQSSK